MLGPLGDAEEMVQICFILKYAANKIELLLYVMILTYYKPLPRSYRIVWK